MEDYPLGRKPLRGLRLIHTHLNNEALTEDDLTDLALLRLDLVAAIGVVDDGPADIHVAYILPPGQDKSIEKIERTDFYRLNMNFAEFVEGIESEIQRTRLFKQEEKRERAMLLSVSSRPRQEQEDSIDELSELAESSDMLVLKKVIQRPRQMNPRYLMGEGKLKETIIEALNLGATIFVFDQDLSPSQMKAITDLTEMKVIDRSQLILDVFARRAHSRDGKVQVELAQLKYRLPRLTGKGTAMSRLMGGIGGRGPGEMKLEVDRRRVRDRISLLEKEMKGLAEARKQRKQKRIDRRLPIVSIVGYTNAGKSTLLNALTESKTFVERRMFATLDTASRRLRFPKEREIIITDTVGFIRDLPKDLLAAFKSTLEELADADLLLHLVDASNPRYEAQMASVERILDDLKLKDKPELLVFNKTDLIDPAEMEGLRQRHSAVFISALKPETFKVLLNEIESAIWHEKNTATEL